MPGKILIVDDEAPVRDVLKDLLIKERYRVFTASSGEAALDILGKEDFDAILLDIKLSGISGLETLKKIKEKRPATTVIMITGFGYDEDLVFKCNEFGCCGYIGKNADISHIIHSFKTCIKSAKEKKK